MSEAFMSGGCGGIKFETGTVAGSSSYSLTVTGLTAKPKYFQLMKTSGSGGPAGSPQVLSAFINLDSGSGYMNWTYYDGGWPQISYSSLSFSYSSGTITISSGSIGFNGNYMWFSYS